MSFNFLFVSAQDESPISCLSRCKLSHATLLGPPPFRHSTKSPSISMSIAAMITRTSVRTSFGGSCLTTAEVAFATVSVFGLQQIDEATDFLKENIVGHNVQRQNGPDENCHGFLTDGGWRS